MATIIAIHSFRGGTGKSNTTAALAALLAGDGHRVAVVDTDIQSPGIHVLFGLDPDGQGATLNDFLWGKCEIARTARDVTAIVGPEARGRLFLVPSSIRAGDIARVLHYGYDVNLLRDGCLELIDKLDLDFLFIDTHPGLNEETLMSVAVADVLLIILRPDQQDYQGTAVTVEVARQLEVAIELVVNKVPPDWDRRTLAEKIGTTYTCPVLGVLPHADEMMILGSAEVFALARPDHPLSRELRRMADRLGAK